MNNVASFIAMKFPEKWAELHDRKLVTVTKHFLPELYETLDFHDAFSDIKATYELWKYRL